MNVYVSVYMFMLFFHYRQEDSLADLRWLCYTTRNRPNQRVKIVLPRSNIFGDISRLLSLYKRSKVALWLVLFGPVLPEKLLSFYLLE